MDSELDVNVLVQNLLEQIKQLSLDNAILKTRLAACPKPE